MATAGNKRASRLKSVANPAELRGIFGKNLCQLSARYKSISALCRELGINRTQYNRYLSGESFPRPDILHQICLFFDVDARILLEPIENISTASHDLINHPMLAEFFGEGPVTVEERLFPSGFYRFIRQSFIGTQDFMSGIVHVTRKDEYTFLRGYEPRQAIRLQGLSANPKAREFRGIVMRQEEGVMAVVSHRNALACSFNFLTPETSFQSNLWEGYATRTVREKVTGRRATRMVYEHLGYDRKAVLNAARNAGLMSLDAIPLFHARLLQPGRPFK